MAVRWSTGLRNTVLKAGGKSLADTLLNGVIRGFTGTQPANGDAAETGTFLIEWTLGAGAFTPGNVLNGLEFELATDGILYKKVGEIWRGVGVAAGVIGWARFYSNAMVAGISTTSERFDMAVATVGSDMNIPNTTVTIGGSITLDSGIVTFPVA